jgi:hypothetical protein
MTRTKGKSFPEAENIPIFPKRRKNAAYYICIHKLYGKPGKHVHICTVQKLQPAQYAS